MATSNSIPSKGTATPAPVDTAQSPALRARAAGNKVSATGAAKSVVLDVARKDIASVEVVDTDFVLTTKSNRKILIRDGALNAVTDEEFFVIFSDSETVPAKVLFGEAQSSWIEPTQLNWSDVGAAESSLVVPAVVAAPSVSLSTLGAVGAAVALAAAGGGKSSSPASGPDQQALAAEALKTLGDFANNNVDSQPTPKGDFAYVGTEPTKSVYETAGVQGMTDTLLPLINDALATPTVTDVSVNTLSQLQAVVDAYAAIVKLANGQADTSVGNLPGAETYARIGVSGFDSNVSISNAEARLLSDMIDRKNFDDVNTVKEIQALADAVAAVMANAAGKDGVTAGQLKLLGFGDVPADKMADVVAAIASTSDDGSEVDTFKMLSELIDSKVTVVDHAVQVIATFADLNTTSQPTPADGFVYKGTAPTAQIYQDAGVSGPVSATEVAAFNDALATHAVTFTSVNTGQKVSDLAAAYRAVLSAADGTATPGLVKPTTTQYNLLGVAGLDPSDPSSGVRTRLLGDVIDQKNNEDVNTVLEIQALADKVARVMNQAKGEGGLTADELTQLGVKGVNADNLSAVIAAIQATADDGTGVDTYTELQNLATGAVSQFNTALSVIQNYAQNHTDANQLGADQPTVQHYVDIGLRNVTPENVQAINSALATLAVTGAEVSTAQSVGDVVNAYLDILNAANGISNPGTTIPAKDYTLLGVTGVDTSAVKTSLLGDVIDRKSQANVDSTVKLQALANDVMAVMNTAAGSTGGLSQADQLTRLGVSGVSSDNFDKVKAAIQASAADGTGVDTVAELQALVNSVLGAQVAALKTIADFANQNVNSKPLGASGFTYQGTAVPSAQTYIDAGVTGTVSASDAASFNDALATRDITGSSVATPASIQLLVDTYRKVFALADGTGNTNLPLPITVGDYLRLGVDGDALQNGEHPSNRLKLLNDIVDRQVTEGVDTIQEINQLIAITNTIQDWVGTSTTTGLPKPTPADFARIGIRGVSEVNIDTLLQAIQKSTPDQVDSVGELQDLLYKNLTITFTAISDDTGYSGNPLLPNDFITHDNTLTFSGSSTAADGTKIRITLKRINQADITLESTITQGAWQARTTNSSTSTLADGTYTVQADLLDLRGVSVHSEVFTQAVTIDTSASKLSDGSDDNSLLGKTISITGISPDSDKPDDYKTNSTKLIIKGSSTAAEGTHVGVSIDGQALLWTTVKSDHSWQLDHTGQELATGSHTLKAFLADTAGNTLGVGASQDIFIDTSSLTVTNKTSGAIGASADLILTFSAGVKAQAGKFIRITDETNAVVMDISVTDPQVSITNKDAAGFGTTVTIHLTNDLVSPHNYHATIDTDAFITSSGVLFKGLPYSQTSADWRFQAVDPSTTVTFTGPGVDASNGLSAAELSAVSITGTVSGASLSAVSNVRISKLSFTTTDNDSASSFEVTDGLPGVIDLTSPSTRTWTFANNSSWTSKLVSGKTYIVTAQLDSSISGSPQSTTASSVAVLIDKEAPQLTGVVSDKTALKAGDTALFTFTFSEDPSSSFTLDDLVVAQIGGVPVGSFLTLSSSGKVRTALFKAADNVTFTPTANTPTVQLAAGSFTDTAGNLGSLAVGLVLPDVRIDTQAPVVNEAVVISGIKKNGTEVSDGDLVEGDKLRITVTMSELTQIVGIPNFGVKVGNVIKQASYVQSKGNALVFEYTVIVGDGDDAGGITADANSLTTTVSRITDLVGNDAVLNTSAVVDNTNSLRVSTTGANDALTRIRAFAQANTDPNHLVADVPVPSVSDYVQAGIKNADATNIDAINNALATAVIDAAKIADLASLQNLVSAYNKILTLADGSENTLNVNNPDFLQYGFIGVQGVDSVKASLLGDVIDLKNRADVDTVAEIQDLANAVSAVMNQAKNLSGLTLDQLKSTLNIQDVTADNLAAVLRGIANTADDGSGVDTLPELQAVVTNAANKAAAALSALQTFANANTDSLPTNSGNYVGTVPTWSTYTDAGINSIPGITDNNLASLVNDALATSAVTGDSIRSIALLQSLVSAYGAVANLANGRGDTTDQPDANAYTLIGVQGLDPGQATSIPKARLLSDVIDRKVLVDVDTVKEIQALANAVSALMANAAGSGRVTVEQLQLLGFDVPANKIDAVVDAIATTPHRDGTDVDTYAELFTLINSKLDAVDQAIRQIANFADLNIFSQPTPVGGFVYKGTPPTAATYNSVGLTTPTVTETEAKTFNDALATSGVTFTSVDTKEEIQALIDAYRLVMAAADGEATPTLIKPTLQQYALLGVTGLDDPINPAVTPSRINLLGDVIDRKGLTDVDTVLEIQALANTVTRVMNKAQGIDGVTHDDLIQLGVQGVTNDNLAAVLQKIADSPNDGTGVDTYTELQNLVSGAVTQFDAALKLIQDYAKAHADPTQLGGDQPTVQTYLDLGITSVTAANLKSMNSALATASVTEQQVSTAQAVQALVNAYIEILKAADNVPDADVIQPVDYTLLGVSGVVGSDVKARLLSDVIDRKATTAVDTADELQALANTVGAVMNSAANASSGGLSSAQQLTDLGVTGVTNENFAKVLLAIQSTGSDGTGVDSVKELQDLVNGLVGTQQLALSIIGKFADANVDSQPLTGNRINYREAVPTRQTYLDAGVTGALTEEDVASFNDALATNAITGSKVNSTTSLQGLVDAYRKFFVLADGSSNGTPALALTSVDCERLGVETSITGVNRLNLLSDMVDRQSRTSIDTVAEINQLVLIANAVQDQAAGVTTVNYALTADDFTRIGVRGVSANNLSTLLSALRTAGVDGSDSVPELQKLLFDNLTVDFTTINDDTGASSNDFITSDNTLNFSGTSNAADGTKIRISFKRTSDATSTVLDGIVSNGLWQVSTAQLPDGDYTLSAQLFDGTTPASKLSTFSKHVMVDTSSANRPDGSPDTDLAGKTIAFTNITNDTGEAGAFTTSDTTLIFSGTSTAAVGTLVAVKIDGGPLRFTKVQTGGVWQFDNTQQTLASGKYNVAVFLADAAGNTLSGGDSHIVTINTSTLNLVSQTTGPIASSSPLKLTFNANVVAVAGKFIHITDESTGEAVDIAVNNTNLVKISDANVTLTPAGSSQLVAGKNYHATIDAGAFKSTAGTSFDGLLGAQEWRFQTVDPTTTIMFSGTGVDASNGINASELAALTVSGLASSTSWVSVGNPKVTQLTFTSTDGAQSSFVVSTHLAVGADRTWTLANASSWTSQLISGKSYTVKVKLESDISGTHQVTDINNSTSVLIDTTSPSLTIKSDITQLATNKVATITFTFDEVPVGFTINDIAVPTVNGSANGTPIGTLSNFQMSAIDPKVFTVAFTPTAGITLPSTVLVSVAKSGYTDVAGNVGKNDVNGPVVSIDTQAPVVNSVTISGLDSNNVNKTSSLDVGDKIKITLNMSEVTNVGSGQTPKFMFDLGGVSKEATYTSGSGSNALVFLYTIAVGDNDNVGGITASAGSLTLAQLSDAAGNITALATPAATSNTIVVDTNGTALKTLADAAQANNASTLVTPLTLYQKVGVARLDANNLNSYNSALNSAAVTSAQADTTAEVQDIVDAYNTILNLADGGNATNTFATDQQYQLIGVTGLDNPTPVLRKDKAQLLSDAIDRKAKVDVDTVPEVQGLADAVVAVMKAANGVVSGAGALTRAQLESLGVLRVTDLNFGLILSTIAATADDGTAVNTVAKLQALVDQGVNDAVKTAIATISNFAADNTVSSTSGTGANFAYASGSVKPVLNDYLTAGVSGVTPTNIDAINDALATASVDRLKTNTTSGIQKVVDAYKAVLALADGANGGTALQSSPLLDIGVTLGAATNGSSNLSLLNSVLDIKANTDVDTVQEINDITATINAIMDATGNRTAPSAALLTTANLTKLGLLNLTDLNLAGVVASISAQTNGSNIDTLTKLQALVSFYNASAPTVALLADTGSLTQDSRTNNANLNFGLSTVPGAVVFASIDGGKTYVRSNAFTQPSSSGDYTVLVRQVSPEGYLGQTRSLTFTLDLTTPDAVKLNATANSNVDTVYYGASDFGKSKFIAPNIQLPTDGDIAVITLNLGGANTAADSITFQSGVPQVSVLLNVDKVLSSQTIGGVTGVNLNYTVSNTTLAFSSDASRPSRIFTNAEVQLIERALSFNTSSQISSTRTFKFSHTDVAGNSNQSTGSSTVTLNLDNTPPSKLQFSSNAQQDSVFYNAAAQSQSSIVAIASNLKATTDTDIAKIQLTIGGQGLSTANDRIIFGDGTTPQILNLAADANGSGLTVGGVTGVNWVYTASTKVLVFTLSNNGTFTGATAQNLETSLKFQILSTVPNVTQGARTFSFDHIDVGGLSTQTGNNGAIKTILVDTVKPQDPDVGTAVNNQTAQIVGYGSANANAAKQLLGSISSPPETDISSITLAVGGPVTDASNDKLVFGTQTLPLNTTANSGLALVVGGVTLNWSYNTSKELSFSKANGTAFNSADVNAIEQALSFQTTGAALNGDRTFKLTHTDQAGNISNASTVTVKVNYVKPSAVDLDGNSPSVQATGLGYYNRADTTNAKTIAANIALGLTDNISFISVALGGVDGANDKLSIGGIEFALVGGISKTQVTVQGIQIAVSREINGPLTLQEATADGSGLTALQVQIVESNLLFKTTANAQQGNRTFAFTRTNVAGNTSDSATQTIKVDFTSPSAIDLDDTITGINNTSVQYHNRNAATEGTITKIAPKIGLPTTGDADILSFSVTVGGASLNKATDVFMVDAFAVALSSGNSSVSSATLGGVQGVSWSFNASTLAFSFVKSDGSTFLPIEVQTIERALGFKTDTTRQGDRIFTFKHTDQAGNSNTPAIVTLTVDSESPSDVDLDDTKLQTQNTFTLERVNAANVVAGVRIAPMVGLIGINEAVATILIMATGRIDAANDKLVLNATNSISIGANNDSKTNQTIGTATGVNVSYASATQTFTFSKSSGVFTPEEVQSIERSLVFTSTTSASSGDRSFVITHADLAGNTSNSATSTLQQDARAPLLTLDTSSGPNFKTVNIAPTTAVNLAASTATVTEDVKVSNLQIKVRGLHSANEQIVVASTTAIDASGTLGSGSFSLNAVSWRWTFNPVLGAFLFSVTDGATAAQAQDLLRNLSFKTTNAQPGDDVRQFFFTATDGFGNTSNEVSASVSLNQNAPAKHSTNAAAALDANADQVLGDMIVLTFTEPVKVSLLSDLRNWTIAGGTLSADASANPVDAITVNGESYATNFLVKTGLSANIFAGQERTLTLAGGLGGTADYGKQSGVKLPEFTLTSKALTLEAWVYANYTTWPTNERYQRIFDFGTETGIADVGGLPGIEVWLGFSEASGKLAFEYINSPPDQQKVAQGRVTFDTVTPTQSWQHVALTVQGKTATLYVNGLQKSTTELNRELPDSVAFDNNWVGKSNWIADSAFKGSIFDARVYTNARSATQIRNDYNGQLDLADTNLLLQYDFNGDNTNNATGSAGATLPVQNRNSSNVGTVTYDFGAGTAFTIKSTNVVDASGTSATADQVFRFSRTTPTVGDVANNTIAGTTGNDFIAGQGGNDTLRGDLGADTFAWFKGETGTDTVADFKVAQGDMVDLSGLLEGKFLSPTSSEADLSKYLQLTKVANDMVLKIDVTGGSFVTTSKTITFTGGADNGLDDTLINLVKRKVIHLDVQSSTPLVLDLNGDGVHTLSLTQGVAFDIQGEGRLVKTGWVDGQDGLLVLDLNHDGVINSGRELFGSGTQLPNASNAKDGIEALSQYDLNRDNVIDANDEVFNSLQLWVDANHDGVTDPGELHALHDFKVQSINLNAETGSQLDSGNLLGLTSNWTDVRGNTHDLADVWFNTTELNNPAYNVWENGTAHVLIEQVARIQAVL